MADPLARDAEFFAHFRQGAGFVGEDALAQDPLIALAEIRRELIDLFEKVLAQLRVAHLGLGAFAGRRKAIANGRTLAVFPARRGIEIGIGTREPIFHFDDVFLGDIESFGDKFGLDFEALALQACALLVELEEKLARSSGRSQANAAHVVEDVLEDIGADPINCVRRQLYALVGVIALHRFHQADIALLDEVQAIRPGTAVLHCNFNDQAQV